MRPYLRAHGIFKEMNFSHPHSNALQLGLREGMRVVDLGTGSGHYTLTASQAVGEEGRVYAVDIQEDVLVRLKAEMHRRGIRNVETVWGDFEKPGGTTLREQSMDAAILSNVLFQLDNVQGALAEIKRVLKPGGKLLVIDWAGAYGGMGPHEDQVVKEHQAEELFIRGGFYKAKDFRAGPHHYAIVFTAP